MPNPEYPRPAPRPDKVLLTVLGLALALLLAVFFWWQMSPPLPDPGQRPVSREEARQIDDSLAAAAEEVYAQVEQMPQPPGGMDGLMQYLGRNIRYPVLAQLRQVQGRIYVSFVVSPTGEIRDAKVTRGIGGGCDEEALRVISQMPAWKPGRQDGRPVSVQYTLPVTFALK